MHMHTTAVQLTLPHAPRGSVAQHDSVPLSWACFPSTTQLTQVTVDLMTPDEKRGHGNEDHRVCSAMRVNASAVSWSVQSTLVQLQGRDAVPASTFLWHVPLSVEVTVDPYVLQVTARSIHDGVATARSSPFCVTEYHPTYSHERFIIIGVMLLAMACSCHGVCRLEPSDATTRPTQRRRTPPVVTSPIALVAPRPSVACTPQHRIVSMTDEEHTEEG